MSLGFLSESCPCGADFLVPADHANAGSWCREFREAHEVCRETAAQWLPATGQDHPEQGLEENEPEVVA